MGISNLIKMTNICKVCNGKGEVVVSCLITKNGKYIPIKVFRCVACGGKGSKENKIEEESNNG